VFFKQPVPALDPNNNPVWIVVTFEAVTASASTYVAGANVERRIDNHLSIGITGVTEEQSPTNYTLFGLNSKYQLNDAVLVSGEFARSNDFAEETGGKSTGDAYKVEAAVSPFAQLVDAYLLPQDGRGILQHPGIQQPHRTRYRQIRCRRKL